MPLNLAVALMARLPRLYAPLVPQLVLAQFSHPLATPADPAPALQLDQLSDWLQESVRDHRVAVHGWVLLSDRLALLATPPGHDSLPKLMQAFGRKFATRMRHGRVFSGRYRSALVEPGKWVLPALIWLESLPVQLHYADGAQFWPWSSAAYHTGVGVTQGSWLTDHHDYWEDGNTPFARQAQYAQRLSDGLSAMQSQRIEQAVFGQWALGEAGFLSRLETLATRRLIPAPRGRPRKIVTP